MYALRTMTTRDEIAVPTPVRVDRALLLAADVLGERYCWLLRGAYHFRTGADGWTISVTPESADRFRVSACRDAVPATTVWVIDGDDARLAELLADLRREACAAVLL